MEQKLLDLKIGNVDYKFVPVSEPFDEDNYEYDYSKVLDRFENGSLDAVLIDGIYRSSCALRAINKIKR